MSSKIFIIYIVIQKQEKMSVHLTIQAQVKALIFDKAPTKVLAKYSNYSKVFLVKKTAELQNNTGINNHTIELKKINNHFLL